MLACNSVVVGMNHIFLLACNSVAIRTNLNFMLTCNNVAGIRTKYFLGSEFVLMILLLLESVRVRSNNINNLGTVLSY